MHSKFDEHKIFNILYFFPTPFVTNIIDCLQLDYIFLSANNSFDYTLARYKRHAILKIKRLLKICTYLKNV